MPRPPQPRSIAAEQDLARRMQVERERRGWSHAALADRMTKVGCPMQQSAIWKIENGTPPRRITVNELVALALTFETDVGALLDGALPSTCWTCGDGPPDGFTCNTCGRSGP